MSKGTLALPVLDYEFDGPDQYNNEYNEIRPKFEQTGSPRMDLGLNLAAQLFWQKNNFPDQFSKVDEILFWPQYWSFWLSGIASSEISYASSHSDLWDIRKKKFIDLSGFDENFFLYYEDNDLIKRLLKNNEDIYKVPINYKNLLGSHNYELNFPIEVNRNWHLMWSKFYFKKKHYGYFYAFFFNLSLFD